MGRAIKKSASALMSHSCDITAISGSLRVVGIYYMQRVDVIITNED